MGTGFSKRKKEARALQEKLSKMRSDFETTEVTGVSSQELVTVTLTGEYNLKQIKIKPECVDPEDIEGLQDLIKAAFQDAKTKLDAKSMQGMGDLPSIGKLPFTI